MDGNQALKDNAEEIVLGRTEKEGKMRANGLGMVEQGSERRYRERVKRGTGFCSHSHHCIIPFFHFPSMAASPFPLRPHSTTFLSPHWIEFFGDGTVKNKDTCERHQ